MPKRNDPADVFNLIDTKDGDYEQCWIWQGSLGGRDLDRGYISIDGKKWLAHRLVYVIVNGDIPARQVVRHRCDNSLCCNPLHLELGTQSDNENDKYKRDRAGLPTAIVREIKRLLETMPHLSQEKMAAIVSAKYGRVVSRESVRNIKLNLRRQQEDQRTAEEVMRERIITNARESLSDDE